MSSRTIEISKMELGTSKFKFYLSPFKAFERKRGDFAEARFASAFYFVCKNKKIDLTKRLSKTIIILQNASDQDITASTLSAR